MPRIGIPRASKEGDKATVARKRYYRSAERNLKKAENASGAAAQRYRMLAKLDFEDALSTYSSERKQKLSKPMQRLANEFGVDVERFREQRSNMGKRAENIREESISSSEMALEGFLTDEDMRRERNARTILNSDIGSRVYAGLVDVWRDKAVTVDSDGNVKTDNSKIREALHDYFGVTTDAEMLEKIENAVGEKLYSTDDENVKYQIVKLDLQRKVKSGELVQ